MQTENIIKTIVSPIHVQVAKKMLAARIVILFILSVILVTWKTYAIGAVTQDPVKWHPGHYVMLVDPGKDSPRYMSEVYRELEIYPAIRGVAMRFKWSDLELAKDVYDFKSIDKHLAQLAARNKRLVILLETKSFKPEEILIPNYLKDPTYEGGAYAYGSSGSNKVKGYNVMLWNSLVHDRLVALVRALGQRFNSHPHFEGFGLQESAMGDPIKPITSAKTKKYYDNLLSVNQHMRNNFPNTMTFQYTNFPRGVLDSLVNGLKKMGATLGCPDIFLQEPGLFFKGSKYSPKGIYTYYPELSGVIPLAVQVERSNYLNTRHDGSGYQPTITELLNFAKQDLHVNYLFWTRSTGFYDDVLLMLNQKDQKTTPSGGLNSACPTSFASCIN